MTVSTVLILLFAWAAATDAALGAEPADAKNSIGITALLERWEDGITQKNVDLLFSCLSDDVVYVEPAHRTQQHVLIRRGAQAAGLFASVPPQFAP